MAEPISPALREKVLELARSGELGRNAIARQTGVAPSTVTKLVRGAGVAEAFDRSATEVATKAAQIDHAAKRSVINSRLLSEVSVAILRLREPVTVRLVAGKDVVQFTDSQPSPRDLRDLATAVAQLSTAHARLADVDARFAKDENMEDTKSILGEFMAGIRLTYDLERAGLLPLGWNETLEEYRRIQAEGHAAPVPLALEPGEQIGGAPWPAS